MTKTLSEEIKVVSIDPLSIAPALSILFNAYKDNELLKHLLDSDRPGYKQRLRSLIREDILTHFTSRNITLGLTIGRQIVGTAVVERAADPFNFFANWRWRWGMYSTVGFFRTQRLRQYYQQLHEVLEGVDHYWITFIGIHPDYQHHGLGPILLDAIHNICEKDPNYHGISIDLCGQELEHFFEHKGYRKVADIPVKDIVSEVYFHPREGEEWPF